MYAFQVSGARSPETAKKLLAFLRSPEARKVIEAKGMKPPKQ
jgi:ABC-type molybdate transport system substrate-binding protein